MFKGADVVGVNCHFGPIKSLEAMRLMKEGLDAAGIKCHLMVQPLGYHTPDCGIQGFIDLPEFPFGKHYFYSSQLPHHCIKFIYFKNNNDIVCLLGRPRTSHLYPF